MIDLTEKVNAVKHERERQFAISFFDHDKWIYEPRFFYLSDGTKYLPDFYDAKRDAYIEVIGSRQAYSKNKAKYILFCEEYPDTNFEFRLHTGEIVESSHGQAKLSKPRERYNGAIRRQNRVLKHMDGASKLHDVINSMGLSLAQVSERCNVPLSTVSAHYYGQRKNMGVKAALRYVEGLGCTIHEIMGAK